MWHAFARRYSILTIRYYWTVYHAHTEGFLAIYRYRVFVRKCLRSMDVGIELYALTKAFYIVSTSAVGIALILLSDRQVRSVMPQFVKQLNCLKGLVYSRPEESFTIRLRPIRHKSAEVYRYLRQNWFPRTNQWAAFARKHEPSTTKSTAPSIRIPQFRKQRRLAMAMRQTQPAGTRRKPALHEIEIMEVDPDSSTGLETTVISDIRLWTASMYTARKYRRARRQKTTCSCCREYNLKNHKQFEWGSAIIVLLPTGVAAEVIGVIDFKAVINPYNTLKAAMSERTATSDEANRQKLLLGVELGDLTSSHLLRYMQSLGRGKSFDDSILEQLWM
ncbi:hypothetical protein CLF_102019 [Clonorchis sinensis]|uniref:Uncharacterized protein n=1 Tax=Clonorchis sinensis TaxID=79923 RepID=G7Y741_CLOSI|nr:hypothetical protein CLF_102019 [Clonorchis sinensis]